VKFYFVYKKSAAGRLPGNSLWASIPVWFLLWSHRLTKVPESYIIVFIFFQNNNNPKVLSKSIIYTTLLYACVCAMIAFVIIRPLPSLDVFIFYFSDTHIYILYYIYTMTSRAHIAEIVNKANVLLYCWGIINNYNIIYIVFICYAVEMSNDYVI